MNALIVLLFWVLVSLLWYYIDTFKLRRNISIKNKKISVFIPCYNSEKTIKDTLDSLFSVLNSLNLDFEVFVIDDNSSDSTFKVLKSLNRIYPFKILKNTKNLGKARSLNKYTYLAKNDLILFLDSDIIVDERVFVDALRRLNNEKVSAVSAAYSTFNKDFLLKMQNFEYKLIQLSQQVFNLSSVLSLWGGFILIRRSAFESVGKFSVNAITEDADLACKLNRFGYKVRLSSFPVLTYAPSTLNAWFAQKRRWIEGSLQVFFRYPKTILKNPITILITLMSLVLLYSILSQLFAYTVAFFLFLKYVHSFKVAAYIFNSVLFVILLNVLAFSVPNFVYASLLIDSSRDLTNLLFVLPFSFVYLPVITLIYLDIAIFSSKRILVLSRREERAW